MSPSKLDMKPKVITGVDGRGSKPKSKPPFRETKGCCSNREALKLNCLWATGGLVFVLGKPRSTWECKTGPSPELGLSKIAGFRLTSFQMTPTKCTFRKRKKTRGRKKRGGKKRPIVFWLFNSCPEFIGQHPEALFAAEFVQA